MGKSRRAIGASARVLLAYGRRFLQGFGMVLVRVPCTILQMISPGSLSEMVREATGFLNMMLVAPLANHWHRSDMSEYMRLRTMSATDLHPSEIQVCR